MTADVSQSAIGPSALRTGAPVIAGRACADCTLCCKVAAVEEFGKRNGVWCAHCAKGKRCATYETRPRSCRDFYCQWMTEPSLGPEWKPDRAKFALVKSDAGRRLTALVDPGFPGAWRRSPYYETLRQWSVEASRRLPDIYLVDVLIGARCIVILPDREVDLGVMGADDVVMVRPSIDQAGGVDVAKVKREGGGAS